jgi:hypothetical protein
LVFRKVIRKVITILQFLKKTVEPTRHELRMKKPSDLVSTAGNALKPAAKEVLHIEADASSKWAPLCKDYKVAWVFRKGRSWKSGRNQQDRKHCRWCKSKDQRSLT